MTIKEFFESEDKLAIHCDTEEKAKKLLEAFDKASHRWVNEDRYIEDICWEIYEEETCYSNERGFGSIVVFRECDYTILEFDEIEIEDISFKSCVEKIQSIVDKEENEPQKRNKKIMKKKVTTDCKYCEAVETPYSPSDYMRGVYAALGLDAPKTTTKHYCTGTREKDECTYAPTNCTNCPHFKPIEDIFNKIKCNSELTLRDLEVVYSSFIYLEWNNKILFNDLSGDETAENCKYVEELIKDKKIYSLEVKIVDFYHTALKITGEKL